MFKVGITGGIGSGKSTVCRLFAARGIAVYDSRVSERKPTATTAHSTGPVWPESSFPIRRPWPIWIGWYTRPCVPTSPPGPNGSRRSM